MRARQDAKSSRLDLVPGAWFGERHAERIDARKTKLTPLGIDALQHLKLERSPLVATLFDRAQDPAHAEPFAVGPLAAEIVTGLDRIGHLLLRRVAERVAQRLQLQVVLAEAKYC